VSIDASEAVRLATHARDALIASGEPEEARAAQAWLLANE
jgi:hypothetical protein